MLGHLEFHLHLGAPFSNLRVHVDEGQELHVVDVDVAAAGDAVRGLHVRGVGVGREGGGSKEKIDRQLGMDVR